MNLDVFGQRLEAEADGGAHREVADAHPQELGEGGVERKVGFSESAASDRVAGSTRSGNAQR